MKLNIESEDKKDEEYICKVIEVESKTGRIYENSDMETNYKK